jgi:hypothetical protein
LISKPYLAVSIVFFELHVSYLYGFFFILLPRALLKNGCWSFEAIRDIVCAAELQEMELLEPSLAPHSLQ